MVAASIGAASPAVAESARLSGGGTLAEPTIEFFSGVDVTGHSAFAWLGGVWALGAGLYESGVRLRAQAGYGGYGYTGSVSIDDVPVPVGYSGQAGIVEALVGYHWRFGNLTLKAFAGIEQQDHEISPYDVNNSVQGVDTGAKAIVEGWLNLGPRAWTSLDAAYSTAFDDYSANARVGVDVLPKLTVGVEGGVLGNAEYDAGRGGAFVRYHAGVADITLSGGVSGDYFALDTDPGAYVGLCLYRAF